MGLFDALTTAVSGLQAQSFAMQNISGNIANSQTTAYKGIDTNFADLIPGDSVPTRQIAGGVIANSRATNNVQGTIQSTNVHHGHGDQWQRLFRRAGADRLQRKPTACSAGSTATPAAATSSWMRTAIWSTAPAISSKASRLIPRPAIRSAASPLRCNSRAIFCPQAPQPQVELRDQSSVKSGDERVHPDDSELRTSQSGRLRH